MEDIDDELLQYYLMVSIVTDGLTFKILLFMYVHM